MQITIKLRLRDKARYRTLSSVRYSSTMSSVNACAQLPTRRARRGRAPHVGSTRRSMF